MLTGAVDQANEKFHEVDLVAMNVGHCCCDVCALKNGRPLFLSFATKLDCSRFQKYSQLSDVDATPTENDLEGKLAIHHAHEEIRNVGVIRVGFPCATMQ